MTNVYFVPLTASKMAGHVQQNEYPVKKLMKSPESESDWYFLHIYCLVRCFHIEAATFPARYFNGRSLSWRNAAFVPFMPPILRHLSGKLTRHWKHQTRKTVSTRISKNTLCCSARKMFHSSMTLKKRDKIDENKFCKAFFIPYSSSWSQPLDIHLGHYLQ